MSEQKKFENKKPDKNDHAKISKNAKRAKKGAAGVTLLAAISLAIKDGKIKDLAKTIIFKG